MVGELLWTTYECKEAKLWKKYLNNIGVKSKLYCWKDKTELVITIDKQNASSILGYKIQESDWL